MKDTGMDSEGTETSVNIYLLNTSHIYCTYWISAVWSKSAVGRKKLRMILVKS